MKKKEKKDQKVVYEYGNFDRYYGYRSASYRNVRDDESIWNDPRLLMLKKQYFKRKVVLDVGCNSGFLTIALGEKFRPRMILGVDIDGVLITKARNLVSMRANEIQHSLCQKDSEKDVEIQSDNSFGDPDYSGDEQKGTDLLSFQQYHFKEHSIYEDSNLPIDYSDSFFRSFPNNVYFKQENFIEDAHCGMQYDTITCFSVTKWIHLNWGDDGLLFLLLKCYSLLKKFGILILEFQNYSSYHKKKDYTEQIRKNYESIRIKPESIPTILQKIGMQMLSMRKPNSMSTLSRTVTKGFNRPIVVMKKVGDELNIDFSTVTIKTIREVFDVDKFLEDVL